MTENKEMKTEQENSKLQLSDPGPRVDYLYDLYEERKLSKIPLEQISRIQLGQTDQVINCSLIGGNNIEDVILMNNTYKKDEVEKKTIVIVVHKEILMNQWIERIQFVLSGVKIGIVQCDKCKIEDLSPNAFDDIGHVIIDECHK